MNQPLEGFRSRFYIASQSLSYLRHLKHIAHQRKILHGLAKTNAIHINSNFSALTAQTFTRIYLIFTLIDFVFVQPFFTL